MEKSESASSRPPQHKRYVKNFLIDKRFQMAWVARVALVVSIIVGILGYFLYATLSESIELMNVQTLGMSGLTDEAQQTIIRRGQQDKLFTGFVLGGGLVGLVFILSVLTIVVTHRVAGPVYKIKRLLHNVDGDRLQLWEKLRKGDELHDVFEEFSLMLRRLRESRYLDIERLEAAVKGLEASGVPPEHYATINDIIARYRQSVKMD